jgi:hypothetical protein
MEWRGQLSELELNYQKVERTPPPFLYHIPSQTRMAVLDLTFLLPPLQPELVEFRRDPIQWVSPFLLALR